MFSHSDFFVAFHCAVWLVYAEAHPIFAKSLAKVGKRPLCGKDR